MQTQMVIAATRDTVAHGKQSNHTEDVAKQRWCRSEIPQELRRGLQWDYNY